MYSIKKRKSAAYQLQEHKLTAMLVNKQLFPHKTI